MTFNRHRSLLLALGLASTAVTIPSTSPTFAAASEARAIIGNTVHGTEDDGEFYDYYAPNGLVTSRLVDGDTTHGRWTIESGNICLDFPGDTKACYAVVINGGAGTMTDVSSGVTFHNQLIRGAR